MVCPCKYPLHIIDKRDNEEIEYLAFPDEVIDDMNGKIIVPEFEVIKEEGFDRKIHEYMGVMWKDPTGATTKKYEVNDHIVIAGCDSKLSDDGKKLQCKKKELYVVFHPLDEWEDFHIVELHKKNKKLPNE